MLSERVIKEIEKAIGVEDLASKINSNETIESLEFGKTKHFTDNDYRQQVINIQKDIPKDKWEEAKLAGHEMAIKELKQEKGIDFQGKSVADLYNFMNNQIEVSKEADLSNIKSQYENDINTLKKSNQEFQEMIDKMKLDSKNSSINSYLDNQFDRLQIEVPDHIKDEKEAERYINQHRNMHKLNFKSQFDKFDIDEYKNIVAVKNGEILKDSNTLNPVNVDNLVQDYSKNSFMNLKQSVKGRGEGDRLPSNKLAKFKSQSELDDYAKEKGIKKHTSEYDAIYAEFKKNN